MDELSYQIIFAHLSSSSALIPILVSGVQFRKHPRYLSLIILLCVLSLIADVTSFLLMRSGINNWPVGNLFYLVQFVIFFLVLHLNMRIKSYRNIFLCFTLLALINFFFIESPLKFNVWSAYVGGILMIIMASHYLYKLLNDLPVERIQDLPMFWITFGVLIYFSGTLFLFLFNNYLVNNQPDNHQVIWVLHNLLNLTKNIFLAVALWKNYKLMTSLE